MSSVLWLVQISHFIGRGATSPTTHLLSVYQTGLPAPPGQWDRRDRFRKVLKLFHLFTDSTALLTACSLLER